MTHLMRHPILRSSELTKLGLEGANKQPLEFYDKLPKAGGAGEAGMRDRWWLAERGARSVGAEGGTGEAGGGGGRARGLGVTAHTEGASVVGGGRATAAGDERATEHSPWCVATEAERALQGDSVRLRALRGG